ncbi:MAG TPA: cardiolipin synthase ClsB [Gallionella sp.]
MNGALQVSGNRLTLLKNGVEYFPQLCADIDAAQRSIHLEIYIFAADQAGRLVIDALSRASARGVAVRVLLDGYGSAELPQHWVDEMHAAGIEVQWFRRKISPLTLRRSRLRRLHRKLVAVDGQIAYVGGINVTDDIPAGGSLSEPRLDYAVRVQGPLAREIHASTRHLWAMVSWANFRRRSRLARWRRIRPKPPVGDANITFLQRDNVRHRRDIERAYLRAIVGAQREIILANAYFLPGRIFRRALLQAARRGVRVILLLQGQVEYRLQHYATHALYDRLLAGGIEIYEYQASYLHAKVAVVDGEWATVGSSNIDPYSLMLAREANLAVNDTHFACELRASLLGEIALGAQRVDPSIWRKQGLWMRLLTRASYSIVRLMAGLTGYWRGSDSV